MREEPQRNLNPFAFPGETELRSILLIWAILGLCWNIGFFFTTVLAGQVEWPTLDTLPGLERDIWQIQTDRPLLPTPEILVRQEQALDERLASLKQPQEQASTRAALSQLSAAAQAQFTATLPYFFFPSLFLLTVLFLIALLYFIRARRPWFAWLTKSPHREETEIEVVQGLVEEAQALQRGWGEDPLPSPKLLVSRGHRGDGQTHGSPRRPLIVLTRALFVLLRKDLEQYGRPYRMRAIVS